MAKIANIQEVSLTKLKPYKNNAKIHGKEQVQKIAESIKAFGFLSPCLIDEEMNLIAGHGRVMAAKELGMESVPCLFIEGLSEEHRKAYILADNRLTELGEWNWDLVFDELHDLKQEGIELDLTGFEVNLNSENWFEDRERFDNERQEGNEEYNEFLEKFEPKKTTDDCYTPDLIYERIADWVAKEYKVKKENFVRPFYPGGDYTRMDQYPEGSIVVDNPPFSLSAEIVRFYTEQGIKCFLFNPSLTGLTRELVRHATFVAVGGDITYENGANVKTSFTTNLEKEDIVIRTAPDLWRIIKEANDEILRADKKDKVRNEYPNELLTVAMLQQLSRYGQNFKVYRKEAVRVEALDAQKEQDQAIYGGGLLLSEKAAAEKAAAEKAAEERANAEKALATKWPLSEREKAIIKGLGGE